MVREKENKKPAGSGELVPAAQTARLMSDIHLPQTKQNVNKCMAQQEKWRKQKELEKTNAHLLGHCNRNLVLLMLSRKHNHSLCMHLLSI